MELVEGLIYVLCAVLADQMFWFTGSILSSLSVKMLILVLCVAAISPVCPSNNEEII